MRYILCLSYDGSAFCGWQIQPSSPSVQQCLEEALAKLCGGPVAVTGAGRTDTGVHAADYVCHFDLTGPLPFEASDFCYKLNAILPRSVVVHAVLPTTEDFHARFSATQRSYTYFIHRKKDPFVAAYSWQCGFPSLDFDAMNEACQYLLGTHDFSCFEKVGGANKTSICTIAEAFWKPYTPTHVSLMDFGFTPEEGVVSETCGHPRPHKREGPIACDGRGRAKRGVRTSGAGRYRLGAHMVNTDVGIGKGVIKTGDLESFLIGTGITLRCHHETKDRIVGPFEFRHHR